MRHFIFIDETGDPGHFSKRDASKFYQLNLLCISSDDLARAVKHFSRFRYFIDSGKEFKKHARPKQNHINILKDLLSIILKENKSAVFYLEKEKYTGPYLRKVGHDKYDYNPMLFRNYVIRIALENFFKQETIEGEIEIVIDRFLHTEDEEKNLRKYLQSNYNIPKLLHIVQVDSRYTDSLQVVDIIGNVTKDFIEKGRKDNDIGAKIYCIENPDSVIEKGPDTQ